MATISQVVVDAKERGVKMSPEQAVKTIFTFGIQYIAILSKEKGE